MVILNVIPFYLFTNTIKADTIENKRLISVFNKINASFFRFEPIKHNNEKLMYWYEDEVKRLEADRLKLSYDPETLFFGSSSIRLWTNLYKEFSNLKPVNLGFGGSTLAACVWFFERIMQPYNPKQLVVYAGDNDLGDGRHPEELFIFFQELVVKARYRFADMPCYFISLKPSPHRWDMAEKYKYANNLIETEIIKYHSNWHFIDVYKKMLDTKNYPKNEYFANDGLHLSEKGYQLWNEIINGYINVNR